MKFEPGSGAWHSYTSASPVCLTSYVQSHYTSLGITLQLCRTGTELDKQDLQLGGKSDWRLLCNHALAPLGSHQWMQRTTRVLTAGGLPIGAVLLKQSIADIMNVGDHGSTFAGNPLVCHAAEAVVDIITEEGFLDEVARKGNKLREDLQTVLKGNPHVKQVRGLGLIVGVQLDVVSNVTCTVGDFNILPATLCQQKQVTQHVPIMLSHAEQACLVCCELPACQL